ncbi:MAG: SDR family oxidoreductase [Acidobacteria bacterium]|nr:SDR family oxidoreductase [Acidobacteriota bacterium]MDA1233954.1 SDR family oxidoreductase [Acidobacteriota bacterium]
MSARFIDRAAFITGAGSGIGRATALRLAAEGATVAAADIDLPSAEETVAMIQQAGGKGFAVECDVAEEGSMRAASAEAARIAGRIDILFNNAGVAVRHPVGEQDVEGLDRVLRVNIRGAFLCAKSVLPYLTRPGGVIINTASIVGLVGVRNRAAYSLSKGAVITLTKNMALDYAHEGIRVNAVCPGFVDTGMTKGLFADAQKAERIRLMHPLGRFATADDIAAAVAFLASDDAAFITGQALAVDGGFTAGRPEDV